MKFVPFYLLTFIIARDNCVGGAGELSEEDLQFIADRLYPAECSQLLSYLPGTRVISRTRFSEHRGYRDEWITENSRTECLESLYECIQRGKSVGCTRNWLEASLHKLGRADLASRLKKRLKKRKDTKKPKKKKSSHKSKKPRADRSDKEPGKNHKHYSRKKAVTSHVRGTIKKAEHKNNKTVDLFGRRFIIFVAAGSILVLVFLGCIVIVSYRRACRCYENYLRCDYEPSSALKELNKTRRPTSEAREIDEQKEEYTKLVLESDKGKTDDLLWSEDLGPPSVRKSKIVSFDSAETDEEGCNCSELQSKRTMSPCARIKRFFDSQKRHLRGEEDTFIERKPTSGISKRKGIRKNSKERSVTKKSIRRDDSVTRKYKKDRKKTRKCTSGRGKRANRERRANTIRSNSKDAEVLKPIGCACQMCKLFNVTGEGDCNEKTIKRQQMTRKRKG